MNECLKQLVCDLGGGEQRGCVCSTEVRRFITEQHQTTASVWDSRTGKAYKVEQRGEADKICRLLSRSI